MPILTTVVSGYNHELEQSEILGLLSLWQNFLTKSKQVCCQGDKHKPRFFVLTLDNVMS